MMGFGIPKMEIIKHHSVEFNHFRHFSHVIVNNISGDCWRWHAVNKKFDNSWSGQGVLQAV